MSSPSSTSVFKARSVEVDSIVVRIAGDSGDGIQVTGNQFTNESALSGNDLSTLPDFPAEIRAPAGTLAGVSGFQIQFGSKSILTPGDTPDVLIAMNPAALKANLAALKKGGTIVINEDAFSEKNYSRVGYRVNPAEDEDLKAAYKIHVVPVTKLTKDALLNSGLSSREVERCKNFFALGLLLWMFGRPTEHTIHWIETKFAKRPELVEANKKALQAGLTYGEATEIFDTTYTIKPASLEAGTYRNINGSTALSYGLIAAAEKSGLPLFFGAYPITPASEVLHELSKYKHLGVMTFQAEDEIAAVCAAIGASFCGQLAVTSSSGPGIALKTEAITLAVITELPLVIVNNQRGGPSTGLPTKTEQSDLFQALYGRAGEAPLCVIAIPSPAKAFEVAYEACRIALKYMTPVMLLSDGYINNCSEPWKLPDPSKLPPIPVTFATKANDPSGKFLPYLRDEATLARPWATPGTEGLAHRIGGLEKADKTGAVSYDAENHHLMCTLRAQKIERIANEIPKMDLFGESEGDVLVLGWGGTEGTLREAVERVRSKGRSVSHAHLTFIHPLPNDLGDVLKKFKRVLIPEINLGQLRSIIRDKYLVDAVGYNRIAGLPLKVTDIEREIEALLPH